MKKRWSDSDSKDWVVIDLNTVTIITNCVWADDDSGEYEVVLTDNNGEFITENGRIKTEKRRGKIKIVKRGKGWDRISFQSSKEFIRYDGIDDSTTFNGDVDYLTIPDSDDWVLGA